MSNQWSDNLRKRMEAHQEPSPEGLWEDIEQMIEQEGSISTLPKQNKILLWSKRLGAVAAIILAILFIGDYFIIEDSQKLQIITQKKQSLYEHKNNLPVNQDKEDDPISANSSNRVYNHAKKHITVSPSKESLSQEDGNNLIAKIEEKDEHKNEPEKGNSRDESNIEKNTRNNQPNSKKQIASSSNGLETDTYMPIIRQKDESGKWEASVYASNIPSNSAKRDEGYGSFVSGEIPLQGDEEQSGEGDDPHNDILVQNKDKEVYTDIKHRQPIIIGVSANYNLDDKWSITSGLIYTILSSELRSGSDNYYYTSDQTLHNIGIPLNINYNLWKNKKLSVYLSAGGLVEKNVSAKLTTDYIVDNQLKSKQDKKISLDQLQWSLNSSVGIQYNISSKIGLYAEPGVSYYFKNGSEIETIYKEKPLNLNIRLGFRFSLNE